MSVFVPSATHMQQQLLREMEERRQESAAQRLHSSSHNHILERTALSLFY